MIVLKVVRDVVVVLLNLLGGTREGIISDSMVFSIIS